MFSWFVKLHYTIGYNMKQIIVNMDNYTQTLMSYIISFTFI